MKKIFIAIISVLSFTGCVTDLLTQPCFTNGETLINNSGKEIRIISYIKSSSNDNPEDFIPCADTIIKNQQQISKKATYCPGGADNPPFRLTFSYLIGCDSMIIDYGDRVQSYSRLSGNEGRNPFRLDPNEPRNSKQGYSFIYIITPDDYTNATPKP